jgi:hypothetical protein
LLSVAAPLIFAYATHSELSLETKQFSELGTALIITLLRNFERSSGSGCVPVIDPQTSLYPVLT